MIAFHPMRCNNCHTAIPPSTRIKILRSDNSVIEITASSIKNFSAYENFDESLLSKSEPKVESSPLRSETQSKSRCTHGKNCAARRFLITEDEDKSYLSTKKDETEEQKLYQSSESLRVPYSTKKQDVPSVTPENSISSTTGAVNKDRNWRLKKTTVKNSGSAKSVETQEYESAMEYEETVDQMSFLMCNDSVDSVSTLPLLQKNKSTLRTQATTSSRKEATASSSSATELINNSVDQEVLTLTSSPVKDSPSKSASTILVYPDAKGIEIKNADVACINGGKLLNDTIIDFYLKFIYHEKIPEEFQVRTHIFLTFFSVFLKTNFEKKSENKKELDVMKSLNRWLKNVDLFNKDFVFIPLNRDGHWSLAVICFLTQLNQNDYAMEVDTTPDNNSSEARSREPSDKSDTRVSSSNAWKDHPYLSKGKPCICFFDSLDTRSDAIEEKEIIARTLIQFLKMAWNIKNPSVPYDWEEISILKAICPQQTNGADCGLYLLQYVETFFKKPIPYFENPMPDLTDWFPRNIMAYKRCMIKKLIIELKARQLETV